MSQPGPKRVGAGAELDAAGLYRDAIHRFLGDQEGAPDPKDAVLRLREEVRRLEEELDRQLVRPRRVLVVGGAGYIGSVLVRCLLERGYLVRVLDALLYGNASTLEGLATDDKFEFVQGDLLNEHLLHRSLENVTDVVLLAALVGDPICKKYPEQAQQINYHGAVAVLEALNHYPINKVVFTSTCSNYGVFHGESPADEEAPLGPVSLYAETKVAVERYILQRKGQVEYCPTILRLATAFGLGFRTRFDLTVNHFARELALGKELLVYDQTTWRPYCHIEDISDAIIRVLEYPREIVDSQVFNVGANHQNHSKEQIVELIRQAVPDARVSYQAGGSDPRNYQVDFSKIRRLLDFAPRHSVARCVKEVAEAVWQGRYADVEEQQTFYGNYRVPVFDGVPQPG